MRWSTEEGFPGFIGDGGVVAVFIGALDGGDGSPVVVVILGVPDGDAGVGEGDIEQGEKLRGLGERQIALAADWIIPEGRTAGCRG